MRAAIGYGAITAGAAACVLGIVTILGGIYRDRPQLLRTGRRYVFVTLVAAIAAFATMEWALWSHDYSIQYVAEQRRARDARAVHLHRRLVGARGVDPLVGARARAATSRSPRGGSGTRVRIRSSRGRPSSGSVSHCSSSR